MTPDELTTKKVRFGTWEFQQLYMGAYSAHDDAACDALRAFDAQASWAKSPANLMHDLADQYGTTVVEMRKHWPCIYREER
jgi:hypothetical protein